MKPMPSRAAISISEPAISKACARLSSAHGPAISANGSLLPKRTLPTATMGFGLTVMGVLAGNHEGPAPSGQLRPGAYLTEEKAVGRRNALVMLAMIGPSFSLSSRALCQAGSAWNEFHFFSRSASDSQASM